MYLVYCNYSNAGPECQAMNSIALTHRYYIGTFRTMSTQAIFTSEDVELIFQNGLCVVDARKTSRYGAYFLPFTPYVQGTSVRGRFHYQGSGIQCFSWASNINFCLFVYLFEGERESSSNSSA